MDKELLEKIETLHNNEEHYSIIELVYSIDESERDYDAISLLARALNNTQNYDEALDHLMYIREDGIDDPLWHFRVGYSYFYKNGKESCFHEWLKGYPYLLLRILWSVSFLFVFIALAIGFNSYDVAVFFICYPIIMICLFTFCFTTCFMYCN